MPDLSPYNGGLNTWIIQLRGLEKEISNDRSFVNPKDKFMNFEEKVPTGVNRQDQNYFSPGGTHGRNFTLLSKLRQFYKKTRGTIWVETSWVRNFWGLRENIIWETQESTY